MTRRPTPQRVIEVVDPDPAWPGRAQAAGDELLAKLAEAGAAGAEAMTVHHIGSTAVPGLAAKPILDLPLEVPDDRPLAGLDAPPVVAAVRELGDDAFGECGIRGRRNFSRGGADRTHHVHAFVRGSDGAVRHLAFRDDLRAHPEVAARYGEVKRRTTVACDHDIDRSMAGKHAFVQEHERAALAWAGAGRRRASDRSRDETSSATASSAARAIGATRRNAASGRVGVRRG